MESQGDGDANREIWRAESRVTEYLHKTQLFAPERTIFELLGPHLSSARVLDLGIGAGRTTAHLAPLVSQYVGTDYAPEMIQACERRFSGHGSSMRFSVTDTRDLSVFADASFDVVLFSFNGLDYMPADGRTLALKEMCRVAANNAYIVFSSLNLNYADDYYRLHVHRSPLRTASALYNTIRFRLHNPGPQSLRNLQHAVLRSPSYNFGLHSHYIRPAAQVTQLTSLGLHNVRVFGLQGQEFTDPTALATSRNLWLYYLAQR